VSSLAVETESLRKEFGPNVAVADLSLSIERGEVFGFLGPNGAGKTTSLKLLLGLIEPTSGRGVVLGAPIGDRATRAGIGFLPEHFRFHDCLTGRELLRLHGRLCGLRGAGLERRIEDLMARMSLVEAMDRPLRTYSKGMMQRAGLAQALIAAPALVLLDEPTSGLDPLGRVLVRELIEELRSGGTTVFLNSHLLSEVEATCDRVVFVKRGRVVHELSLGRAPESIEVLVRVGAIESTVVEGLSAIGDNLKVDGDSIELTIGHRETLPEIARWLVGRGVAVYEIRSRSKTLEEWFLEVMGDDQTPG
jgi:ABC-2 type transport system ATP-binding protein